MTRVSEKVPTVATDPTVNGWTEQTIERMKAEPEHTHLILNGTIVASYATAEEARLGRLDHPTAVPMDYRSLMTLLSIGEN